MTRYLHATAVVAALLLGTTVTADAQGGPGGGMRRAPDEMALLAKPLEGVSGITEAQTMQLTALESEYKARFTTASTAMREAMMAARQSGGPPDMAAMTKLREQMTTMRTEELAAARARLSGAQYAKFDENVKAMLAEAAAREAQMRERMGWRPPQ